MSGNESPMARSVGSSSLDSVKNWAERYCPCGIRARMYTSWSLNNPGRRFYTCGKSKVSVGFIIQFLFD